MVEDGSVDLRSVVSGLLAEHAVPGAAVGIVDGGGVTQVVTAGSRGEGRGPVDQDTLFAAASLTKPVFACGVMALVNVGDLELDRPLSEYLAKPYLAGDPRAATITARVVLSHTTGFPNWREEGPLYLRWTPGTRWGYSGEGYSYLQQVVEHVVGVDLPEFLTDAVLGPLGMRDSTFVWPEETDLRLALGHGEDSEPRAPFHPPAAKAAAGGMFATVTDYLRFLVHSLTHDQAMFDPQVRIDDGLAWGLGWGIEVGGAASAAWQWGNDPGYKNFVIARPADGQGAVVFTNGDNGAVVYDGVVRSLFPGSHPSLETEARPAWKAAWSAKADPQ
jgi:CubicO group peptidase (beta-lactamase class C family)